jgi:uncharacterized protein (DUF2062 family)
MTATMQISRAKKFWQERVVALILAQFTQGFTPQKIALTLALGMVLGIFPILGATTALCALAGLRLKLNQPVIQLVNWLVSPLQLALILVFARIGEWLLHAPRVSFSLPVMFREFHESPARFFHDFGMTGVRAILAWLLIAPVAALLLYLLFLSPLKKLSLLKRKNAD